MSAIPGTRRQFKEMADGTIRVSVDIDPQYRAQFFELFASIDMPVAMAPLKPDFENGSRNGGGSNEDARGEFGKYAAALYKSGFWFNPKVLAALGSDDEFRAWVQRQPSAYSGEFSEYVDGEGRCIAAHVRRAGESGIGYKAPYACIPLTDKEHRQQHQHGEGDINNPEWFDRMRARYVQEWASQRLRDALGVESLTKATPDQVVEWACEVDLYTALPVVFRG